MALADRFVDVKLQNGIVIIVNLSHVLTIEPGVSGATVTLSNGRLIDTKRDVSQWRSAIARGSPMT